MREIPQLGPKVRALRRRDGMTQVQLAERLGISPSYMNLIEHNRRSLSAQLLIKVAQIFQLDLQSLSPDTDARLVGDVLEAFGDPVFEGQPITAQEVKELAGHYPSVARAVLGLYQAYRSARESADTLAERLSEGDDLGTVEGSRLPSEEVSDLIQRHSNHFPELEAGAEALWKLAGLSTDKLYDRMVQYLAEMHRVEVRIERVADMGGAMRRYDTQKRVLSLSELLRRGSRNFQLAYQVGLMAHSATLDRISREPLLTTRESRALSRVALANYFASAVLMPYHPFLEEARSLRYDLELLGHRFRTSFEQVCHRLTTLRRPGAEGVPFHFVRSDIAGNISKRFSATGLRFARFSGACPRWCVFAAFLTPAMIRTQLSQMPDGATHFWIARTIRRDSGGYHSPHSMLAIGMGCDVRHAKELVYAEGVDLEGPAVPVGVTCRLCERTDCEQRAFPALQHPLKVDELVRGVSFFAPVGPRQG